MMLRTVMAAFAVCSLGGAAFAQDAMPITNREVVGEWTLEITPADQGVNISFESADGSPSDFPLTITARSAGPLSCLVRERPAECRLEENQLIVETPSRSGGARLIFTLADRTPAGFSGTARIRVGSLPDGTHVGSANMTRR